MRRKKPKTVVKTGPVGGDLEAGRLLLRLTRDEMAHTAALSPRLVRDAEICGRVDQANLDALRRLLELRGITFEAPGLVRHADGRLAPTRKAVGTMKGHRISRARNALGLTLFELAGEARLATATVIKLEAGGALRLTTSVYAAVGALQLAGYSFAPNRGDRRVGERRKRLGAWEKDLPLSWLDVGLGLDLRGIESGED